MRRPVALVNCAVDLPDEVHEVPGLAIVHAKHNDFSHRGRLFACCRPADTRQIGVVARHDGLDVRSDVFLVSGVVGCFRNGR